MTAQSKSRWFQYTLSKVMLLSTFVFLAAGLIWALLPQPTDCGGNNPVIVYEKVYLQTAYAAAMDSPNREFVVTSVPMDFREVLGRAAYDGEIFVSRKPFRPDSLDPDEVVIVCDHPYTNRPRFWFQQRVAKHAVGYADGRVKLLTVPQFEMLDKSLLVSLKDMLANQGTD